MAHRRRGHRAQGQLPERRPRGDERIAVLGDGKLGQLVRSLRDLANGAKDRMREEMGPEFDDVDWKKLDPRQYDPRRIIREALTDTLEDDEPAPKPVSSGGPTAAAAGASAAGAVAGASSRPIAVVKTTSRPAK